MSRIIKKKVKGIKHSGSQKKHSCCNTSDLKTKDTKKGECCAENEECCGGGCCGEE